MAEWGVGGSSLVGRSAALVEVASLLEERHWSRGGFVLITGPAGIGKTRLAEEACARAVGYRVVWNWCGGPGEGSLHPWPRVVRALAAGNASVSRLARRSAHLSAAGPVGARPLPLGGEAASGVERRQLFDDVSEILAAAAAEEKFLLVLDDLHDAGPSSLELLAAAAPTFQSNGVVVLATARDDEFSWRSAPDLRGPLVRHAHRVALGPLTDAQVGELLRSVGGTDADAGLADVVARRTGGNPLLVVELAKSLREGDDALNTAVPFSVEAMVAERTSAFPAACRALLAVAAVLGPRFRLDVLADAADVPLADVRDVLDGAERAGIVSFTEPGEGRFAHELVRDSIYGSLSAPERTRRHGEVASVLMRLGERGRGVGAAEIASHLVLAGTGDAARATDFAWRAGDDARRIAAYADAARWYDQAIRCLDLAGGEDGQRCELLLASGEAHLGGGDRSAARAEFTRVAALAREVALPTFLARAALSLSSGSAGFEVDMFDREQIDLLWEAHAALPEEEAVLRALVAARLSIALTMMDPEGQRGALAREAITLARAAADDRAIVQALAALCDVQAGPDHAPDRLRYADEMLQRATTLGDWSLELLARRFLLVANLELGDLDAADDQALAFRLRAARARHPLYEWYGPLWKAMRALLEGRFAEVDAANAEAAAIGERAGSTNAVLLCDTQRWCRLAETGDRVGLEALAAGIEDAPLDAAWVQVVRALIAGQLGHLEDARRALDAVAPRLASLPRDSEWLAVMAQVAEVIAIIGTHPVGAWVYDALLPYANLFAVEGIGAAVRGPLHRHLGLLATASGCTDDARQHFEAARARSQALGATQLTARIEAEAAATALVTAIDTERPNVFRRDGELWVLRFEGREVRLPDAKGLRDLALLVAAPGREIAALDLAGAPAGGDAGPVLDRAARDAYRRRLQDLEEELDDAGAMGDLGRTERLAAERDALVEQLTTAFGLGGRARRAGSPAERARTTVTARIRHVIRRIEVVHPELGRHLDRTVRTGTFCVYEPGGAVSWTV